MFSYKLFEKDTQKGYNFPFILMMPQNPEPKIKIFVECANSTVYANPNQQSMNAQILYAKDYANAMSHNTLNGFNTPSIFNLINQPFIIPVIRRCDFEHDDEFYPQQLSRNVVILKNGEFAQLNKQILAMIDVVKDFYKQNGYIVEEKSGLYGASSSGVFATRLQFIEPKHFDVCLTLCSGSVTPLPLNEYNGIKLQYPLGTADFKEIFGTEFNLEEYKKTKQLHIVGSGEDNARYDITKNALLHSNTVREQFMQVYGNVTLQQRQKIIDSILKSNNFLNVDCIVCDGLHSTTNYEQQVTNFINQIKSTQTFEK